MVTWRAKMTKKYKKWYLFFLLCSVLLNLFPTLFYTIKAAFSATLFHEKLCLSAMVIVVVIMTLYSLACKVTIKSKLWLLLLALYVCLDNLMQPLIIIAVCQIVDEIVCTPLKNRFKSKFAIHKEIDKRL